MALRHLGNLNLTRSLDYRKAYRNLQLARQIATEDGNDYQLAFVLNSLSSLYTANIVDNDSVAAMADRLLLDALRTALRSHNKELLPTIGMNIAFTHFASGDWGIYGPDIQKIKGVLFDGEHEAEGKMLNSIIAATDAFFAKDFAGCERNLLKARASIPDITYAERYGYMANIFLINYYLHVNEDEKALATMHEVLADAQRRDLKDYQLSMLYQLAKYYDDHDVQDSVEKYYNRYLQLKDVLKVESGYGEIETLDFLTEIERINHELEALSIRHQTAQRNLILTVSFLVVVAIILLALFIVHRNLRRKNRELFNRNEEAMRREAQHKLLREEWEKERMELNERIATKDRESEPIPSVPEETEVEAPEEDEADREMLMKLYTRILKLMDESTVIYQPGFSLQNLSDLLKATPRNVSRAINVCHDSNFHQLLNEYRIREVTRLMHDPACASLTIEAIAEKAGFQSRTSFSRLFKNMVGLPPSEYMKMARK